MVPVFFGEAAPSTNSPVGAARTPEGAEGAFKDSTPTEQHRASGQRPKTQKRLRTNNTDSPRITFSSMCAVTDKLPFKNYGVAYNQHPNEHGCEINGSKNSQRSLLHSRETKSLYTKLESDHMRQMGAEHHTGLRNKPVLPAKSTSPTCGVEILPGRVQGFDTGSAKNDSKAGGITDTQRANEQGIHFSALLCPKEGWRDEAYNQLKEPQHICGHSPLQNGEYPYVEGYTKIRRLDDESRPERCLLYDTHGITPQTPTEISVAGRNLSVQLSPIRSVICSVGLYQDHTASSGHASVPRTEADHLHRRHSDHGNLAQSGKGTHSRSDIPARKPGIYYQSSQIPPDPNSRNTISWVHNQLQCYGDKTPWRQDQTDTPGHQEIPGDACPPSPCTVQVAREAEPRSSGDTPSPIVLPESPALSTESSGEVSGWQRLPDSSPLNTCSFTGTAVVAGTPHQMEWSVFTDNNTRCCYRNRCLHYRMGSSVSKGENRGTLVKDRETAAHKLLGVASSNLGNKDLCKDKGKYSHPSEDGQHNSSDIHKQVWGHSLLRAQQAHQRAVVMVPGEEHYTTGNPPSRDSELHSRRGVTCDEGQIRLDAVSRDIQQSEYQNRPTPSGPLCLPADQPTQRLRELETRSRGHGHRCLHPGLDQIQGVCQSPLEPDRKSPDICQTTESTGDTDRPCVEVPSVVPSATGNVGPGATPVTSQSKPDNFDSQSQQTRNSTPSSRMGYLRDRFRGQNLSEEASKLLLSSWRQKTSKSYDSLFGKWIRWCNQRDTNPISGSINEVVNFLADLFQQGYQYRSLNAYRSAISSVHERVDGYEVGQHPLVTRLIKGAFHERPPQPSYTTTWDVATVTTYLQSLGDNQQMHISDLTHKTVMLMALTRPSRSIDLAGLNTKCLKYSPEGVTFIPIELAKQSRQTKKIAEFFFPVFPANDRLCPVTTLRAYQERTRDRRKDKEHSQLFISLIKPYNAVTSSTIARWLKSVLTKSGIDTDMFKAHSIRGASTSAAANAGVTTNDILNAADWSSVSVFQKFYYRSERKTNFGSSVLAKLPTTTA